MRESVCSEADTGALVVLLLCVLTSACLADAASDLERGRQLYEARDYEGAIQVLNPLLSADAALAPEALKWIASCYYEQRKYPEALAGARTRVELVTPRGERETIKDARGQLATALRDGGEIDAAVDLYRALLDDYPELASAYYYGLGICRKARWSYEQAAVEFTDSEKSAPHQTMANIAFLEVSDCVFRQGKTAEADALVQKACADYSFARSEILLLHAEVRANYVKDYGKAATVLQEIIAAYSGYPTITWDARARLVLLTLWQLGNPGEARAMLTEMLGAPNLHPAEEARLKYYLAYCSHAEEEWAAAREAFQSVYENYATGAFHASAKYGEIYGRRLQHAPGRHRSCAPGV